MTAPDVEITRFCRELREHGLLVGTAEVIDALRAVAAVDVSDREEVFLALRGVLTSRAEDLALFDALFLRAWGDQESPEGPVPLPAVRKPPTKPPRATDVSLDRWMRASASADTHEAKGYSSAESLGGKAPNAALGADYEAIERAARRLIRRLARRVSRRWRVSRRGARVHLRHVMRRSLATGGELVELSMRSRRPRKRRVVALCDVSGSMELYSRFLLQFLYALQNAGTDVETFVFATRLSRVTRDLRGREWEGAVERVSDTVRDWSGGTRIGEAVARLAREWPRILDRHSVLLIASDGWDTGEPELLACSLDAIRERGVRIVWLSPLLGAESYRPETRALAAALPYVDVFAPLYDVASLDRLSVLVLSSRAKRGI